MAAPEDIARLERIYENDQVGDRRPESVCGRGKRTSVFPRLFVGDRKNPLLEPVWNAIVLPSNEIRTLPLIFLWIRS